MTIRTRYQCSSCGHLAVGWSGKCPACGEWGTMEEVAVETGRTVAKRMRDVAEEQAMPLPEVPLSQSDRVDTGLPELNRVLGGGLVPDAVTMLTAKPGAGKSTLLLQVAGKLAARGVRVLYASGEESAPQIRMRAERILHTCSDKVFILSTSSLNAVLSESQRLKPAILIVDSIQTMALAEFAQRPGTPTQTVQCCAAIVSACKQGERPMAAFVVGHVTKDETMAGLRTLEHQVDTVLYLESGYSDELRLLRSTKNRFGYTDEVGLFQMSAEGLSDVTNPYDLFLTRRDHPISGAAVSLQKEGSRLIPIEIEALVSPAYDAYPTRIGDSLRRDDLNTLVSILSQRAHQPLHDKSVVLKATGGLALREKVCDLAILVSIASASGGWSIDGKDAFCAEVGLTGELKRATEMERRLRELDRLGFRRVFIAEEHAGLAKRLMKSLQLQIICAKTLMDVLRSLTRAEKYRVPCLDKAEGVR